MAAAADETRWVVRLTPRPGSTVRDLLALPLPLDVWERQGDDALVAALPEGAVREIERRRLAGVERLGTTAEVEARARSLEE